MSGSPAASTLRPHLVQSEILLSEFLGTAIFCDALKQRNSHQAVIKFAAAISSGAQEGRGSFGVANFLK